MVLGLQGYYSLNKFGAEGMLGSGAGPGWIKTGLPLMPYGT